MPVIEVIQFIVVRMNGATYPFSAYQHEPERSKAFIPKSSIEAVLPAVFGQSGNGFRPEDSGVRICSILVGGRSLDVLGSYEEVLEKIGWNEEVLEKLKWRVKKND